MAQQRAQRGELLREQVTFGALARVVFHQQRIRQRRVQALLQQGVLLFESGVQIEVRLPRAFVREGESPDPVALRFVEAAEIGHKAVEQVGFGHQHIDREVNAQLFVQFDQAFAQRAGLGGARFGAVAQQIGDADGDHHAVDRLAGAVFFSSATKLCHSPASSSRWLSWVV